MAMVFSMQGVGQLMVPLVGMGCLYAFGPAQEAKREWSSNIAARGGLAVHGVLAFKGGPL